MIEKNSSLVLTESEFHSLKQGILPYRLYNVWGMTLEESLHCIATGQYTLLRADSSSEQEAFQRDNLNGMSGEG